MVVGPGQRHGACATDAPIGRLESDDAADRGGETNRAARVAAERARAESRRHPPPGATRRTTRARTGAPRIPRGAVLRAGAHGGPGALGPVEPAEGDGAGP